MLPSKFLFTFAATVAAVLPCVSAAPLLGPSYHPVVVWHGLGDSAFSEGMIGFADALKSAFPGMYVHLVSLADDLAADQRAGFFGNLEEQVPQVCEQLAGVPELRHGFDAIGFSQGGQFMRAYVERCNVPAVRNLVTFGSQHMGVADLPACKPTDLLCRLAEGALRGSVYSDYSQSHIVTAQYFRNPRNLDAYTRYLAANHFISDINNEVASNATYAKHLRSLDALVLLMFDEDITVRPRESGWFESYHVATNDTDTDDRIEPLRQSSIYTEDRIGLRTLDKRGSLVQEICHGAHMQIDEDCQRLVFGKYVGVSPPLRFIPAPLRRTWYRSVYTITGLRGASMPTALHFVLAMALVSLIRLASIGVSALVRARRPSGAIRLQ